MSLLPFLLDESSLFLTPNNQLSPYECELIKALDRLALTENRPAVVPSGGFRVFVDVQQFKPDELSVKLSDSNTLLIEGKHDEKKDQHGYVSRQFLRKYTLPEDCDTAKIETKLSPDGVLTVTAPKKRHEVTYVDIPIVRSGEPSKTTIAGNSKGDGH